MAIKTAIKQSVAQTTPDEDTLSSQGAPTNLSQIEQETGIADLFAVEKAETARLAHAATTIPLSAVVFATSISLAAAAFFTFGLVSIRVMPTFRRLVADVEDVRVPILLPVTLAEIAQELLRAR